MALSRPMRLVEHVWNDWAPLLHQDYEQEQCSQNFPVTTLPFDIRSMPWNACRFLRIHQSEVPSHAARIIDRYLSHLSKEFLLNKHPKKDLSSCWNEFREHIKPTFPIIVLVCVRLSFKTIVNERALHLSAKYMASFLLSLNETNAFNMENAVEEINNTEVRVLRALDYRMPLWTSLQIVSYIADAVGVRRNFTKMMNYCELYRPHIEAKAGAIGLLRPQDKNSLRTLPLCAGLLLMMTHKSSPNYNEVVNKIVSVTRLPRVMIECVCDAIEDTMIEHLP